MNIKYFRRVTYLVVHWLGLHASTSGDSGSILGQGTKILHGTQYCQKIRNNQKTNLWKNGRLCGETRGMDQSKTSSGFHRIRNVFILCEVMGMWIFILLLCFKTSMYIFFDPVIPLLRNLLVEMKDQYTRICTKKKERKIKQKK